MRTWQQFDRDGKVVGSVTAESIADACRKTREMGIEFPVLVEIPKETARSIQNVVEEKTNLEIYLTSMITEKIVEFEKATKVPVRSIQLQVIPPQGYIISDLNPLRELRVNIELDINNIR